MSIVAGFAGSESDGPVSFCALSTRWTGGLITGSCRRCLALASACVLRPGPGDFPGVDWAASGVSLAKGKGLRRSIRAPLGSVMICSRTIGNLVGEDKYSSTGISLPYCLETTFRGGRLRWDRESAPGCFALFAEDSALAAMRCDSGLDTGPWAQLIRCSVGAVTVVSAANRDSTRSVGETTAAGAAAEAGAALAGVERSASSGARGKLADCWSAKPSPGAVGIEILEVLPALAGDSEPWGTTFGTAGVLAVSVGLTTGTGANDDASKAFRCTKIV